MLELSVCYRFGFKEAGSSGALVQGKPTTATHGVSPDPNPYSEASGVHFTGESISASAEKGRRPRVSHRVLGGWLL